MALVKLMRLDIPVKYSMEIARLSVAVDKQVDAFRKVRDTLISNYQIKVESLDEGRNKITSTLKGEDDENTIQIRDEALKLFSDKVNELITLEGDDITNKFHIPDDIKIQPELLKPLLDFVEFN